MARNLVALFAAVAAAGMLTSCGGGGSSAVAPPPPPPPPPPPVGARGTLITTGTASTISTTTIDAFAKVQANGPSKPGESATCAVSIRRVDYATISPSGTAVAASAGLLVPTGAGCTGAHPLLSAQHGTAASSGFDGSDAAAPLPLTAARYFASHGYVVVIPDYLGYGASRGYLTYHPYVDAEANAATVIDAVRATRHWFATTDGIASGVTLNGQVFLFGTSEGGYVTMAAQRTMERDYAAEFPLTVVVPTSGAYDLSTDVLNNLQFADAQGDSESGAATILITSYQQIHGDIYTAPAEVFQSPWSGTVTGLFPGQYGGYMKAMEDCKIPFNVAASPGPPVRNCPRNALLQAGFVADYLARTPGSAGAATRVHVDANNLVSPAWSPAAPTVLCYGNLDVEAQANALAAGTALGLPPTDVVDVQTTGPGFITSWMDAASKTDLEYHGQVEAPGCTAYARYVVFDTYATPL
jgi:pimeloyl-ACP methyl ester carboxylesterase